MTTKLTENEITIKNLREEIEKLNNKIQTQQKQQVISTKTENIIKFNYFIIRNNHQRNLH